MKKRILSILLSVLMVLSLFPVSAVYAAGDEITSTTEYNGGNGGSEGIHLSKTASYDPDTGKLTITIEAYTTGTVTVTNIVKPTDIVLLLDVSGSMDNKFSNNLTNMEAMQDAVEAFINATKTQNDSVANAADKHSIAIVSFASSAATVADFTTVDAAGAASLISSVNSLDGNGATAVDYGMTRVANLLSARAAADGGAYAGRNKVVVVFTDGTPTHNSSYEGAVAHSAVNTANAVKESGAIIYTIGIFSGANVEGTDSSNVFMHHLSSNYPKAYSVADFESWDIFQWYGEYVLHKGDTPHHTGYYKTASDASSLTSIFSSIAQSVGAPAVELGDSAFLVDVVSEHFTIDGVGSDPQVSVTTSEYQGSDIWAAAAADPQVIATVSADGSTVSVSGFDYDENYISETARDGFYGKKLILTITATPNYEDIDKLTEQIANGNIETNVTAYLADSDGNPVASVDPPVLPANKVTYQIVENGVPRTVATYYRFPGAEITVDAKPEPTAVYTYGDWESADVSLSGGNFTMPAKDVVITSEGTVNEYTVSFEYIGNVPAGADPATAPTSATYKVGDTVTLPAVTAPAGYNFMGWVEDGGDIATGLITFPMPAEDLHFEGQFTAGSNKYTVEHYLMDTEGNYPASATYSTTYTNVLTDDSVTANTSVSYVGFTFHSGYSGNVLSGTVAADGSTTLKVYYQRNKYEVSYIYDNTVPGASALPATAEYYYQQEVIIAPDATAPGYTFTGWSIHTGDTSISGGKMVMPDREVVLHGAFNAKSDTKYTVEHYFEKLEGGYEIDNAKTEELAGQTDTTAIAMPLSGPDITGFTYNESASTASGIITGDGSLVLKLYYDRTVHKVTYQYTGTVPGGASALPVEATYKYGEKVDVADDATATGYVFSGWSAISLDLSAGEFDMPARDIIISGHFNAADNKYTEEHYLMDTEGNYPTDASHSILYTNVKTGDAVTANTAAAHVGFTFHSGYSGNVLSGTVAADGSTVLKVYYQRNKYQVSYIYDNTVAGATDLPDAAEYYYQEEVTIAPDATAPGYTFTGWSIYSGDATISGGVMVMPAHGIVLHGAFVAEGDTKYTVRHHFEKLDGSYEIDDSKTQTLSGETGKTAYAVPLSGSDITGFTYNDSASTSSGTIAGDGSLVLDLYYDRTEHKVTYQYTGTVPGGASALPVEATYKYGEKVTVAADATATGYVFSGWSAISLDLSAGEFDMPARDIIISGHFSAASNKYTVEHYLMDTEGNYPTEASHSILYTNVKTGDAVTANTAAAHVGFTFHSGYAGNVLTGTVAADGSTTLKVYYQRNKYQVSYIYDNTVPGATALPGVAEYYYEEEVTIAPDATALGYTFTGWSIHTGDTSISGGKMVMPDHAVVLHGAFTAGLNTAYTVEHYFADLAGNYHIDDSKTQNLSGETGTTAYAVPLSGADIVGFTYNASASTASGIIAGDGSLVLKLYYDRTVHKVTYQYMGKIPAGASVLPVEVIYKYGEEVTVAAAATAPGYTFSGWSAVSLDLTSGKFDMPARDIIITGHFDPNYSKYTVIHYLEDENGQYTVEYAADVFTADVNVDDIVNGTPKTFNTYTYNADVTAQNNALMATVGGISVPQGTVNAEGTLVLKLYYSRNIYTVSYKYEGTVPANAPAVPASHTAKHGTTVDLADITAPAGYEFDGWYNGDVKVGDSLVMPAANVTLTGKFTALSGVPYTVEYYKQNIEDDGYTKTPDSFETTGTTGELVTAPSVNYTGFTFNAAKSNWSGRVAGDGSLVLKLYYDRNIYNVSYFYFGDAPKGVTVYHYGAPVYLGAGTSLIVTESVRFGAEVSVQAHLTASDDAYEFSGWYTNNLAGVHFNDQHAEGATFTMPANNVDFLGAFHDYIVAYDLDGGTLNGKTEIEPNHVNWNSSDLLPAGTPAKSGMIFNGWYHDDSKVVSATTFGELAGTPDVQVIILKAKYTAVPPPTTGGALLTKVDADSKLPIAGVQFELYTGSGVLVGTYTTDANGKIAVYDLDAGSYYWVEIRPAEGYILSEEKHTVTVYAGANFNVTVENTRSNIPGVFSGDHYAYIIGYEDGLVHPERNITRAEATTIFFRLLDKETRDKFLSSENSFADVDADAWYNVAVSTLAKMGIVNGRINYLFGPDEYITRAEFAAMAARFDEEGNTTGVSFDDIYEHWAFKEINIASHNGWILGYEDGTFKPDQLITRAEAMAMVNRVLQRIPENADDLMDGMIIWPDNKDKEKWYYLTVQEATNSHDHKRKDNGYEKWTKITEAPDWKQWQ